LELLAVYRQFLAGAGGAAVSSVWYKYTFCCRADWPAAGSWRATYRNYRLPGAAGWCMKKYSLTRFYYLKPAAPLRAYQAAALCARPADMGGRRCIGKDVLRHEGRCAKQTRTPLQGELQELSG